MSCLKVMYINQKSTNRFKTGEIYDIGCNGKYKGDFLIISCDCGFLKKIKKESCKVISYEWGMVYYNNNVMVLLNKDKIREIQEKVKSGIDIQQKRITAIRNNKKDASSILNSIESRKKCKDNKGSHGGTSMADDMMKHAYIDESYWDWHN